MQPLLEAGEEAFARAIARVERSATQAEQLRDAEHRAFMAEQRELLATLFRDAEAKIASVRDGVDGKDGEPGPAGDRGEQGERGEVGERGADGIAGEKGETGERGADGFHGEARGLFDAEAEYRALDVVGFNGCEWRAKYDNPGPLPGEGWMLSAQRGKKGDRGEAGPEGKPGASIVAGVVDRETLKLTLTREDGEEVDIDLHDVAHVIRDWLQ